MGISIGSFPIKCWLLVVRIPRARLTMVWNASKLLVSNACFSFMSQNWRKNYNLHLGMKLLLLWSLFSSIFQCYIFSWTYICTLLTISNERNHSQSFFNSVHGSIKREICTPVLLWKHLAKCACIFDKTIIIQSVVFCFSNIKLCAC